MRPHTPDELALEMRSDDERLMVEIILYVPLCVLVV